MEDDDWVEDIEEEDKKDLKEDFLKHIMKKQDNIIPQEK